MSLTPNISDKSDKSRRGELLAGKERAFVSRLGSQGRAGGRRGGLRGRPRGVPVEPLISPQNKLCRANRPGESRRALANTWLGSEREEPGSRAERHVVGLLADLATHNQSG